MRATSELRPSEESLTAGTSAKGHSESERHWRLGQLDPRWRCTAEKLSMSLQVRNRDFRAACPNSPAAKKRQLKCILNWLLDKLLKLIKNLKISARVTRKE